MTTQEKIARLNPTATMAELIQLAELLRAGDAEGAVKFCFAISTGN